MTHVVMVGMIEPYKEPIAPDTEVWGINGAFRGQAGLTRVYMFDHIDHFPEGFADELNLLPDKARVICSQHWDQIPRSEPFPIQEIIRYFNGMRYWVCTAAYMVAHAIYEGAEKITLHGMYHPSDSSEYMAHKGCVEAWLGMAMGAGIQVECNDNTSLFKAYPWESPLYGYETNECRRVPLATLSASYKFAYEFPRQWTRHGPDDIFDEPIEHERVKAQTA
jgi:hypothetical protein